MNNVRQLLQSVGNITALTGAGISAESGIPTFRGAGGLWRNFRPEDLATPQAFARDPKTSWEWYLWRRQVVQEKQPNAGHLALVELEKRTREFALITQNVDGLHERAGSRNVIRLHGSLWEDRCTICSYTTAVAPDSTEIPPKCRCGALLRPGVVWFGEALDPVVWDNAHKAVQSAGVLLVIGTSAVVYPAASLVPLAKQFGATVIEINPEETPISSSVDHSLRGPAGEILPKLL